ncbi:MAG: ATP-binding cassette domain-containing protein [Bacteroidaceae bacterium]|nr:ATP-binding cassette domain-containing protein [Bacteroidaceae bacterium]
MQKIIEIKDGKVRHPDYRFNAPINLEILAGEQVAIVGPNGGGKSMLIDVITGKHALLITTPLYDFSPSTKTHAYENIKYISFRDSYGDSDGTYYSRGNRETYYYQQRWNQHDTEDMPLVGDILEEARRHAMNEHLAPSDETIQRIYKTFKLDLLLDKPLILLSSGELRKFTLTKTLLTGPRVLILDNPFIGLDAATRDQLKELLTQLSEINEVLILLVLSKTDEIPEFITHVIEVEGRNIHPKVTRSTYLEHQQKIEETQLTEDKKNAILSYPYSDKSLAKSNSEIDSILDFRKVSICYGERTILKELDWKVNLGECWALSGENGAGKSTLLSLVCADNPQSYACDIRLFGKKRGTGESIWDIKRHIGYVSPEMHRAYLKDLPAIDIVASGLHDSVGLYQRPKPEQRSTCEFWMDIFGIGHLKDKTFLKISSGEQRLVLLARAFVKDPDLLILDEPLHGLDLANRALVKEIIQTFSKRQNKTLVMVTHYKEELPPCFNHEIFLKRNK